MRELLVLLLLGWVLLPCEAVSAPASPAERPRISRVVKLGEITHWFFSHTGDEWLTPDQYMDQGGGHRNESALSILARVAVLPTEQYKSAIGKVRVRAFKGENEVEGTTFSVFLDGTWPPGYVFPVLIHPPLCERVTVQAEALDEKGEPLQKKELKIWFGCGE